MPEKCRVVVCGFDPMLVKAYVAANARACWWHVSDELYDEFKMQPKMKVQGKLLKVYAGKTGQERRPPMNRLNGNAPRRAALWSYSRVTSSRGTSSRNFISSS